MKTTKQIKGELEFEGATYTCRFHRRRRPAKYASYASLIAANQVRLLRRLLAIHMLDQLDAALGEIFFPGVDTQVTENTSEVLPESLSQSDTLSWETKPRIIVPQSLLKALEQEITPDPLDDASFLDAEAEAVEDWLKAEAAAKRAKAQGMKPFTASEWVNMLDKQMEQAVNDQSAFERAMDGDPTGDIDALVRHFLKDQGNFNLLED